MPAPPLTDHTLKSLNKYRVRMYQKSTIEPTQKVQHLFLAFPEISVTDQTELLKHNRPESDVNAESYVVSITVCGLLEPLNHEVTEYET